MASLKYLDPVTGEYKKVSSSGGGISIPASNTEPETGNYWLDTSAEGGTYYTSGEVDVLLEGKAPAGFGLGESEQTFLDDCNNAVLSGWYSTINDTLNVPNSSYSNGTLLVSRRFDNRIYQEYHDINGSEYSLASAARISYGTADTGIQWGPWEWINPPMKIGVEYRTTERYLGKPVYVKAVDCGYMPNTSFKSISIGDTAARPFRAYGRMGSSSMIPGIFGDSDNQAIWIGTSNNTIAIWSKGNYSSYTAVVTVYYTKTTD